MSNVLFKTSHNHTQVVGWGAGGTRYLMAQWAQLVFMRVCLAGHVISSVFHSPWLHFFIGLRNKRQLTILTMGAWPETS